MNNDRRHAISYVQCIMLNVSGCIQLYNCTMYIQYTLYSVQYKMTLYDVYYILYNVQCTSHSITIYYSVNHV